jgi:hypothetical protein
MDRFATLTLAMTAIIACCITEAKAKRGSYQKDEPYKSPAHFFAPARNPCLCVRELR